MHEMGVASSILEAARTEVARYPGAKLIKVGVRIGEWSGIEPESLRFSFDCLVAEDAPPTPVLEIQFCPRKNRCTVCAAEFSLERYQVDCPSCGASATEAISGEELDMTFVEMEEP